MGSVVHMNEAPNSLEVWGAWFKSNLLFYNNLSPKIKGPNLEFYVAKICLEHLNTH